MKNLKSLIVAGMIGVGSLIGLNGCEDKAKEKKNDSYSMEIETTQNKIKIMEDETNTDDSNGDGFPERYGISLSEENGQQYVFLFLADNHGDQKYDDITVRTLFKDFGFIHEREYDFDEDGKSLQYHEHLEKYSPEYKTILSGAGRKHFEIKLERYDLDKLPSQIEWRIKEIISSAPNNLEGYLKKEYEYSKYHEE